MGMLPHTWSSIASALDIEANSAMSAIRPDRMGIYPAPSAVFRAFDLTPPERVKVVIFGQDPYPTAGHANGLAFSVPEGITRARSLINIAKEFESDIGCPLPTSDFTHWAQQGVLLVNTALTVEEGKPGSHSRLWAKFAHAWIEALDTVDQPRVWILWGAHARKFKPLIGQKAGGQAFIESAHPSPLSARRGFFGSRPFTRANDALVSMGVSPVDWLGEHENAQTL